MGRSKAEPLSEPARRSGRALVGCQPMDLAALGPAVTEIWCEAKAEWPAVKLDERAFIAHLALHLPSGMPALDGLRQMRTGDLYLACACATGDAQAVAAFDSHCLSVVPLALAQLRVGPHNVTEVQQRIRHRVLVAENGRPRIADFRGRGALRAWVRVLAVREGLRILARDRREVVVDDLDKLHSFVTTADPEIESMKTRYRD